MLDTQCTPAYIETQSYYLTPAIPFLWYPVVYHYLHGLGQAKAYRGIIWYVEWQEGVTTWINRNSLKIVAY